MLNRRLNLMLVTAGLICSPGCATSGLRLPFHDTLASLGLHKSVVASSSGNGSEEQLSPEFREAQKVFKKDPEGTMVAWARWQEDVGEYAEARKKYRELLIAYPDNIEAQLGLARIELSCGRVKQAEDILTAVAKKRPENAPVRLELGRLYTHQEEWQKAISAFEDASAIDPTNQVCRYELGIAFARSHQFDQALSHLTFAVGESAAHYNIGYILHEQGNDSDATEWFQNALHTHPDSQTAEKTRAMLAQLSPKNLRERNSIRTYPSANPAAEVLTSRPQPSTVDRFAPASLEVPVIRSASVMPARSASAAQEVPSYAAAAASSGQLPDPATLLPPVIQQPLQNETAGQAQQTPLAAKTDGSAAFRTVSHNDSQDSLRGRKTATRPPQWRAAAHEPAVTQSQEPAPAQWRGR